MTDTLSDKLIEEVVELLALSEEHARQSEKDAKSSEKHADVVKSLLDRALYKLLFIKQGEQAAKRRQSPWAQCGRALLKTRRPVRLLTIRRRIDQTSQVVIDCDESYVFELSEKLTGLLLFTSTGELGHDGVVSYQTVDDAAKALSISKHAVTNLVYRLRRTLYANHFNPYLLDTTSDSGIRFLVRDVVIEDV